VVVTSTVSVPDILEITGGLISRITGELGPKRSHLKMPVDQKGSWSPGLDGDPKYTTIKSPEEFSRIKRLSKSG
jgi:hypothetical protein